jgi:hypothetical protein
MRPSGALPPDLSFLPVSTLDVALNRLDRVAGHAVRSGQQNVAHGRDEYELLGATFIEVPTHDVQVLHQR